MDSLCNLSGGSGQTPILRNIAGTRSQIVQNPKCSLTNSLLSVRDPTGVIMNFLRDHMLKLMFDLFLDLGIIRQRCPTRNLTSNLSEVNAESYPCEDGTWNYVLEEQDDGTELPAVIFERSALPPPSSQIAIRYFDGEGDPSDFCGGAK